MHDTTPGHRATRLTSMLTGDSAPLDLVTIRATVRRALQDRGSVLPRPEDVAELTMALRGHLRAMLDEALDRAARLDRHTGPWHRWQTLIDRVRTDLSRDAGAGLCSATSYMRELGRTARYLADCLDE
ncbi:hypothetical protein J7W19_14350 [Streptomyces mobaraensis NBRC 13819 = DSM 40847]|uniref:Uncharacterized protein n=1 Tax=Streptomyces mobaraensis (strain ATCC 29032 / DSM 40847 / JCM 4168 / NBRC 13819 / NCIMB 11159 / IPCR 16-22) TaxID=1223523 RepID=M3B540_STRM1|nr:DUF6415 family natural product biosynthesis protein [Streptomyces mobaraensis]EMF01118.1 hypothetical protein H340_08233 [Streptomyces mobaraensis NBRC 13819 = DSM 40847]QTT74430.1 hypothetical protein J7W19_14350 [Streptomyces mobaraensis NBRC 13819 = DSM 40847]